MFSIDEGGRDSLIDATSKAADAAVCPNHTVRANNRFIIETLSFAGSLRRLKSKRVDILFSDTYYIDRRYNGNEAVSTKKSRNAVEAYMTAERQELEKLAKK